MMGRIALAATAALMGLALAVFVPSFPQSIREVAGLQANPAANREKGASGQTGHKHAEGHGESEGHTHSDGDEDHGEGELAMTAEEITAAEIVIGKVGGGVLVSHAEVPGTLIANGDKLARVNARVAGTVAEVRKRLGDTVKAGEIIATIESREISDAKGEYLAASRAAAFAKMTLAREARLWDQRVSAEQDFLQARAAAEEASIRLNLARQRLSTLGLSEGEVAHLATQPIDALRRLELRAPLSGRVIVRSAISGGAAAAEAELFTIADLSTLWVEMTIPPRDLHLAQEGRTVAIRDGEMRGVGRIAFLSPLLDPETRAARAVAEVGNLEGNWRPGAFVIAELTSAEQPVDVSIPRSAVQDVAGQKVVFLRTAEGFERREVVLGREDSLSFEILSGLEAGMEIAIENTFVLKAAFGKSEASHSH